MKYPQNGSLKGVSTLLLAAGPKGKLMKTQFGQQWTSSIYQLFLFLSTAWNVFAIWLPKLKQPTRQEIVETAYSRPCTGKIGELIGQQWRRWTGAAV